MIFVIIFFNSRSFSRVEIMVDEKNEIYLRAKSSYSYYPEIPLKKNSLLEILKIKGGLEISRNTKLLSGNKNYNYNLLTNEIKQFYKDDEYNLKRIILSNSTIEYQDYIFDEKNILYYNSKKLKNDIEIKLSDINKKLNFLSYINYYSKVFLSAPPALRIDIVYSDYVVLRTDKFNYVIDSDKIGKILEYHYQLKEEDLNKINELAEYLYINKGIPIEKLDDEKKQFLYNMKKEVAQTITNSLEKDIINLFDLLEEKEKMAKIMECNNSSECKEFKK